MTNEEMMGMLASKNPCASPPSMNFDPNNPTELAPSDEAVLNIIGGVPPFTYEILQASLFYIDESYIAWLAAYSDATVKATTHHSGNYEPWFSLDPTLVRHGPWLNKQWLTIYNTVTNQRLNVDLGSAKTIKQIMLINGHTEATQNNIGINHFDIQGSNDASALAQTDHGSDLYWTDIATGKVAAEHGIVDYDDPQIFNFDNETAYRYYSLKIADNHGSTEFLGIRHLQFHTAQNKVYSFVTNDRSITIQAPSYALWTCRVKVIDACDQEDNAWLYTSEGVWTIVTSTGAGGSPVACGAAEFRKIKDGVMIHATVCNQSNIGLTGSQGWDCSGYGGGSYFIDISATCGGGPGCDHVQNLDIYCWPYA